MTPPPTTDTKPRVNTVYKNKKGQPKQKSIRKRILRETPIMICIGLMGFIGSAILYQFYFPPILVAAFLGTGISAIVYQFLGGIQNTTFRIGTLKLSGSIAALIGCVWVLNAELKTQTKHSFRELKHSHYFNSLQKEVKNFIITDRLLSNTSNIDLNPLPFLLSTNRFGEDYTRYHISNTKGTILYNGSIYRKQAEIIKINQTYYIVSIIDVKHTPTISGKPYVKFAIGEIRPAIYLNSNGYNGPEKPPHSP